MVVASRALIFCVLLGLVTGGENCEGGQVASSLEAIKAQGKNQAESFGQVSAIAKGFDPSTKSSRVGDSSSCKTSFKTNLLEEYDVLAVPLLSCLAKHRSKSLWELQPSLEAGSKNEESKQDIKQNKETIQKWRRDQSRSQQERRSDLGPFCEGSLGEYDTLSEAAKSRGQWWSKFGAVIDCNVPRDTSTAACAATTTGGFYSGRCRSSQHPSSTGGFEARSCREEECVAGSAISHRSFGERSRSSHATIPWSTQPSFKTPKANQDDEVQGRRSGHRVEKFAQAVQDRYQKHQQLYLQQRQELSEQIQEKQKNLMKLQNEIQNSSQHLLEGSTVMQEVPEPEIVEVFEDAYPTPETMSDAEPADLENEMGASRSNPIIAPFTRRNPVHSSPQKVKNGALKDKHTKPRKSDQASGEEKKDQQL